MQCPICQSDADHAVWPYLQGMTGEGVLTWWRCSQCAALFSDLTEPVVKEPNGQHEERLADRSGDQATGG